MSGVSCVIWDLECHQRRQTLAYLVMENFSPDTNMPDMRPFYYTQLIASLSSEIN